MADVPSGYVKAEQFFSDNSYTYAKVGGVIYNLGAYTGELEKRGTIQKIGGETYIQEGKFSPVDMSAGRNQIYFSALQSGKDPYAEIEAYDAKRLASLTQSDIANVRKEKALSGTGTEGEFSYLRSQVGESKARLLTEGKYMGELKPPTSQWKQVYLEQSLFPKAGSETGKKAITSQDLKQEAYRADIYALMTATGLPYASAEKLQSARTPEQRQALGLPPRAEGTDAGYLNLFESAEFNLETKLKTREKDYNAQMSLIEESPMTFRQKEKAKEEAKKQLEKPVQESAGVFGILEGSIKTENKKEIISQPYIIEDRTTGEIEVAGFGKLPKGAKITEMGYKDGEYVINYEYEKKLPDIITIKTGEKILEDKKNTAKILYSFGSGSPIPLMVGTGTKSYFVQTMEELDYGTSQFDKKLEAIFKPSFTSAKKLMGNTPLSKATLLYYLYDYDTVAPVIEMPVKIASEFAYKFGGGGLYSILYGGAALKIRAKEIAGKELTEEEKYALPLLQRESREGLIEASKQVANYYLLGKATSLSEKSGVFAGKVSSFVSPKITGQALTKVEQAKLEIFGQEVGRKTFYLGLIGSGGEAGFTEEGFNPKRAVGGMLSQVILVKGGEVIPNVLGGTMEKIQGGKIENPFQKEKLISREQTQARSEMGMITEAEKKQGFELAKGRTAEYERNRDMAYNKYQELRLQDKPQSAEKALKEARRWNAKAEELTGGSPTSTSIVRVEGFNQKWEHINLVITTKATKTFEGVKYDTKINENIIMGEKPERIKLPEKWRTYNPAEKRTAEEYKMAKELTNELMQKAKQYPYDKQQGEALYEMRKLGERIQTEKSDIELFSKTRSAPASKYLDSLIQSSPRSFSIPYNTKAATRQPTTNILNQPSKQPQKGTIKQSSKQPMNIVMKNVLQEPTKASTKEASKEASRNISREVSRNISREITREITRQPIREILRQPIRTPTREIQRQPQKQIIREEIRIPQKPRNNFITSEEKQSKKSHRKSKPREFAYSPSLVAITENIRATHARKYDVLSGIGVKPIVQGKTDIYGQRKGRHGHKKPETVYYGERYKKKDWWLS